MIGLITLDKKPAGKRSAGNPDAPFEAAGAGNVTMAAGLRTTAKAVEYPPEPAVDAPVLDPTRRVLPSYQLRRTDQIHFLFSIGAAAITGITTPFMARSSKRKEERQTDAIVKIFGGIVFMILAAADTNPAFRITLARWAKCAGLLAATATALWRWRHSTMKTARGFPQSAAADRRPFCARTHPFSHPDREIVIIALRGAYCSRLSLLFVVPIY